jgi:spermidine synthase
MCFPTDKKLLPKVIKKMEGQDCMNGLFLTRMFSTTIWYHYAFLAVSIALFGWGLGGVVLHFFRQTIQGKGFEILAVLLFVLSVFMPLYLLLFVQIPAYPSSITYYFLISIIPFFLAGICLAFLYSKFTESASKLYFADLAGASLACLVAEPFLNVFGAESAVLLLGVIASVSSLFLSIFSKKRKLVAMSLIGLVILPTVLIVNMQTPFLNISNAPTKGLFTTIKGNQNLKIVLTRWNSFSRIDVVEGFTGNVVAAIFIDASASTTVWRWNGTIQDLNRFNDSLEILPYRLVNNPKTLVIGPGGGEDTLYALAGNSSEVTCVELNPIIVEAVQNYGNEVGNIYNGLPNVSVLVDEGRSFVSRSAEKFDVITLRLVDSWAAVAAGGYALAENYLYTKEAVIDYVDHLTDKGLLVMIRWLGEIPRLVSTIVAAYRDMGESADSVGKRMAIVLDEVEPGAVRAFLILKRQPISESEAEIIKNQVDTLGPAYSPYYIPYLHETVEPYHSLFNGSITLEDYYARFNWRVDAVSDDSPYHFNDELGIPKIIGELTTWASLLIIAFVVVPLIASYWKQRRKIEQHKTRGTVVVLFILFFSALGVGYMLLEIALVQKFILFLGYPTRALTVTLFSLLLSSGIGSLVSGRLVRKHQDLTSNILIACVSIIGIAIVYILSLPVLFSFWFPQDSSVRIMLTVTLLFPLGFVMGIPFPSGLRILNMVYGQNISWMWGVNGAASVLGSILAILIGILYGFNYAMTLGAAAYAIALASSLAVAVKTKT